VELWHKTVAARIRLLRISIYLSLGRAHAISGDLVLADWFRRRKLAELNEVTKIMNQMDGKGLP